MAEKYDVVVAGGGHNGLIVAAYLAKAGLNVCVVEHQTTVGGGVKTRELTVPGFKHDIAAVTHTFIVANPLMVNDELQLKSKFGLEYVYTENLVASIVSDGTTLKFYADVDKTCQSIGLFSERDAQAYREFNNKALKALDYFAAGMFSPPLSIGAQATMMEQSPEGQELLRIQAISAWDLVSEWFENDKVKIAISRNASEVLCSPFQKGTGLAALIVFPFMQKYGTALAVGGSQKLPESLVECIKAHGGTIKVSSTVKEFKISKDVVKGVVLTTGEEILATKAVVANLNIKQIFPKMVPGFEPPDNFYSNVKNIQHGSFATCALHLALNEAPRYKVVEDLEGYLCISHNPADVEEYARVFFDLEHGYPRRDIVHWALPTAIDKTRAPQGKHIEYFYAFVPYDLRDGGAERWDDIGQEVADGFLEDMRLWTTNMGNENILGRYFMSPLDMERHNPAMIKGDIAHIGYYPYQISGNRPLPSCSQYRLPVKRLYLTGASAHPGGGVSGGGRNTVQVIMEDLGIDFEKVTK